MSDNGTSKAIEVDGKPAVIVYETYGGVLFHITPINLPTLQAIRLKSEELFPYPDKRPYQHEEENAFSPGQLSPAEDNPDYIAACEAVDLERKKWLERAIFNYCVKCPKYPTKDALIAAFKPQLEALRQIAVIDLDDFDTVLFHIILGWNKTARSKEGGLYQTDNEYGQIIQLCIQTIALTPAEVSAGLRLFRVALR